jgi:predicted DNA-binding WGR domain protein
VACTRYYLIQLLQDNEHATSLFHVFKRWGRVGYSGGAARQSLEQHHSADSGE